MAQRYTVSTKLALAFVAAVCVVQVYRAARQPIHSGEAYLYDRFVRPTTRQVLASELPDRDVLYSLLEKRSVGLFHVSPFSVRLPGVLFGVLYLWSVWRLARLVFGSQWLFLGAMALAGAASLHWGWFVRADGVGTALALELCAVSLWIRYLKCNHNAKPASLNLSGACLGLSVAARIDFAIPAAALALALLAVLGARRQWSGWIDRVFIPAVAGALVFLVLPLSHAHAAAEITPELTDDQSAHLQSALQVLRASAGADRIRIGGTPSAEPPEDGNAVDRARDRIRIGATPSVEPPEDGGAIERARGRIRIGATPSAEPVVNFYRAQHRATAWERARRDYRSEHFDYYLLSTAEGNWAEQRHLYVLHRDADFLLARRSYAPM